MNSKDKGLVLVLVLLLILLIVISGFLLFTIPTSKNDSGSSIIPLNSNYSCYVNGKYYPNCDLSASNSGNDFQPIVNEINNTVRRSSSHSSGGSSGNTRCDDSQVILRLYGDENTHGALWNEGIYPVKVCYDEIFGKKFNTQGRDSHQCSGSQGSEENAVLRLIKTFNSHAEAPDHYSGDYNIPVCYGDLSCVSRNTECVGDEKEIVSLTSDSNAHLESRNVNNYDIRICCTSSGSF